MSKTRPKTSKEQDRFISWIQESAEQLASSLLSPGEMMRVDFSLIPGLGWLRRSHAMQIKGQIGKILKFISAMEIDVFFNYRETLKFHLESLREKIQQIKDTHLQVSLRQFVINALIRLNAIADPQPGNIQNYPLSIPRFQPGPADFQVFIKPLIIRPMVDINIPCLGYFARMRFYDYVQCAIDSHVPPGLFVCLDESRLRHFMAGIAAAAVFQLNEEKETMVSYQALLRIYDLLNKGVSLLNNTPGIWTSNIWDNEVKALAELILKLGESLAVINPADQRKEPAQSISIDVLKDLNSQLDFIMKKWKPLRKQCKLTYLKEKLMAMQDAEELYKLESKEYVPQLLKQIHEQQCQISELEKRVNLKEEEVARKLDHKYIEVVARNKSLSEDNMALRDKEKALLEELRMATYAQGRLSTISSLLQSPEPVSSSALVGQLRYVVKQPRELPQLQSGNNDGAANIVELEAGGDLPKPAPAAAARPKSASVTSGPGMYPRQSTAPKGKTPAAAASTASGNRP